MKPNANCADVAEWLPWYVNCTLDPERCDRLHVHVAQCASCRELLQIEHRIAERLFSRPVHAADSGISGWNKLSIQLDAPQQATTRPPRTARPRWQAVALTAVAIGAFGLLAMQILQQPAAQQRADDYRTLATAPAAAGSATTIDVTVASDVDEGTVQRLAVAIGANVGGGPDRFNRYRLVLPVDSGASSLANAELLPGAAANWLRQQRGIVHVEIDAAGVAPR